MRARSLALVAALVGACDGDGDKEVLSPVVLGMLDTTPPTYDDGEQQIFQVSREVRLPFRRPNDGERPDGDRPPYPEIPFHVASDSRVTVRFTLSNLDDQKRTVELLIDPWNEFVHYVPGTSTVGEDEILPNLSGIQRIYVLEPKSRIDGIITPDDMVELATDLTTAMALEQRPPDAMGDLGGPALYNRAFNIQNRSSEPDPVLRDWLPGAKSTVAAVTGFDVGLRTSTPAKVAVELVVDVVDLDGNRIVNTGEDDRKLRRPGTALTPPAATRN
jgi:hypothetical protein